jgi:hypothetical protein
MRKERIGMVLSVFILIQYLVAIAETAGAFRCCMLKFKSYKREILVFTKGGPLNSLENILLENRACQGDI